MTPNQFLQRAAMLSAVLATAFLSVRLPVRLSARQTHAGIVSKRMNIGLCRLHWWQLWVAHI